MTNQYLKSIKLKTLKSALLLSSLGLIASCNFKWEPDPYVFDVDSIVNSEGKRVYFTDEEIVNYKAFSDENLKELKAAIRKCENENRNRKRRNWIHNQNRLR